MLTLNELQRFAGPHGRLLGESELACINAMLAAGHAFFEAITEAMAKAICIANASGNCR